MIRDNHQKRMDGVEEIQYRNALYQGEVKDGHFQGSGIVYFHDDDHLITCKHFQRSRINGPAFFIYDRGNYHFGEWKDSNPNGVSVFRIRETVIVAQYKNGSILFGSKIVILIEASNVGVVAELMYGGKWQIRQKREVYCMEHIQILVSKCHFSTNQTELSLFRFISHRLNEHPFQLRYIQKHYKFGFEDGLSINFDEQEHITQINARKVKQIYQRSERCQSIKVGQVYNSTILTVNESNFRNKALKDPSKCYFDQFSKALDEGMIKSIYSGFIMDPGNLSRSRNSVSQKSLVVEKLQTKIQVYISPRNTPKNDKYRKDLLEVESYKEVTEQKPSPQSPNVQVGNSFTRSKLVRQPVKLYSFQQSDIKKPLDHREQPSPKFIPSSQDITKTLLPESPQKTQQIKHNPSSKSKKKIFQKSPSKKDIISVSPNRKKDESDSRPRQYRIFPHGQSKDQSSVKDQPKSTTSNKISRADSPIFALKSEVLKTEKPKSGLNATESSKSGLKRQATDPNRLNEKLQTINKKLRADLSGKKRALTEFESDGEILSEDMSNLLDVNSTLRLNESPAKKIRKYNNIYRNQDKRIDHQGKQTWNQVKQPARNQAGKVKSNDNTPYLQQVYPQRQPRQFVWTNGPILPPKSSHSGPSQLRYQYF